MYYMITGKDNDDSLEKRRSVRGAHIARLELLKAEDRLLLAGPSYNQDMDPTGSHGFSGSLIVAEFDSLSTAKAWAAADPYVTAEVYKQIEIHPFKKVLP
jgi:uncharacterized protein YciI